VELWVASAKVFGRHEEIVVRGKVSVPTVVVLERDAEELGELFRKELLARSASPTRPGSRA
jgi:hypothetical protein